ncbi:MAG: methionine--tRNA ligase [bacterium]|nr:methionine--tRNA ligase [bacterium]
MKKNFYLTTTLPYVNAEPHIGFALELVQADIIARYRHLLGDDVFFSTGTDEHGLKIYRRAIEEGKDTQAYVDEYAEKFQALKKKLDLYPELHFIRTTDARHVRAAQELWRRCLAKGDIYKKKYKGLYCVGDEAFVKESDLVGGKCPNHQALELVEIEEENYFFKLSAYQEKLLVYLKEEGVVVPEWRRQEAIQFVQRGLEDFSVSRVKEKMPWGIPVPDDDTQVMYVWFDALTNYISTLGWPEDTERNFKKYWEEGVTLQLAGKDQVRFQSIMWQAMLLSGGLPTTSRVFYHGFITSGGQKMSKSIGNVIDPIAIVDEYGTDALRYFLARHVHPFEDSDVTMERFKEAYNADLVNGLGNLVARVMKLAEVHIESPAHLVDRDSYIGAANIHIDEDIGKFQLNRVLDEIWSRIKELDEAMAKREPFKLVKEKPEEGKAVILSMAAQLYGIGLVLEPFMPDTSKKIQDAIRANKKPENLFPRKE